jgi:hypothetical protein
MGTKVLYYWIGTAKVGEWVGYKGNNFLVINSHYEEPVETSFIFPYAEELIGESWHTNPTLKEAYNNFRTR